MKAISLWQPWATMIRDGVKTIETRMWPTAYRGDLLICSTKNPKVAGHLCGYALCVVNLVDCRLMTLDDETAACCTRDPGRFAWVLEDNRKIEPFEVKGERGFFEAPTPKEIRNSMGDGICKKCGKRAGTTVSIEVNGKRTPQLCSSCYGWMCRNAGKLMEEKAMTRADVKGADVVDRATGEVIEEGVCLERFREILAKENDVEEAEKKAEEIAAEVGGMKDALDEAKTRLSDARGAVAALEAELRDLVRGQKLLF